jgi:RNA polymerase sigma-70 factor (ECF subfamily)
LQPDGRDGEAAQAIHSDAGNRTEKGSIQALSGVEPKSGAADAALVVAIRSGDQSAMGALYDRYSPVVYAVALRVLGDTGAAEDVLQDVFMQLWRNPGAFDSSRGSLGAWLAVITRNRAIDTLRKRRPENDIEDVIISVEPDMAGDADRARVGEKVRAALGSMPDAQRKALELAYYEGLTHSEIAAKTGEPLGTIKTRIRAGLMTLRKAFST